VKTTVPLDAPPVGLAFDGSGVLFALEGAPFGSNEATLRRVLANGMLDDTFALPVTGDDDENFFFGSMTYDHVGGRLLITDNAADGRLYSIDSAGVQATIATGIAGIAGVAVRETGEIFVSTAPFGSAGEVLLVDTATNSTTPVMGGLGFGAGLAFDLNDDLIVQDAGTAEPYPGRLQRLPMVDGASGLEFGNPESILSGMQSSAGVTVDSEGDIFTTGRGGLYRVAGDPIAETSFDENGNPPQFATAIAFDPGSLPFEGFRGPGAGRLAYQADFAFGYEDPFITLLTPAQPGDYNGDGDVDDADYALWLETYGAMDELAADGNLDGSTTAADYVAWRKFAPDVLATSAAIRPTSVPEPTTWTAAALFVTLTICWRRRRLIS
jgi:hypothetical protein